MTQARLVVDLPDGPWIADVSKEFPDATFRVLAAVPDDDAGYALVQIAASDVEGVLDAMRVHPTLAECSVMARSDGETRSDGEATVQFETTAPLLVRAAQRAGVPIRMPIRIEDGEATITVSGSHERLPILGSQFEELGLPYRVERVRDWERSGDTLTDRQREIVVTAVEQGYYDTPRRCSLTELADHLGLAKSTVSETLHRAEESVVKSFLGSAIEPHDGA